MPQYGFALDSQTSSDFALMQHANSVYLSVYPKHMRVRSIRNIKQSLEKHGNNYELHIKLIAQEQLRENIDKEKKARIENWNLPFC